MRATDKEWLGLPKQKLVRLPGCDLIVATRAKLRHETKVTLSDFCQRCSFGSPSSSSVYEVGSNGK